MSFSFVDRSLLMTIQIPAHRKSAKPRRVHAPRAVVAENCVGIVTAVTPTGVCVRVGADEDVARTAVSCLLKPEVGDTVACLRIAPAQLWLLAVLQREDGVDNVLYCEGDTRFEVAQGALTLAAPSLALDSETFVLRAQQADVVADEARLMGRQLRVMGSALKVVVSALSTVFDLVTHFSKHHLRTTEGVDRVQADHMQREALGLMQISGEHTLVNGEKLIKAQGGQIHFG